MTADLSPGAQAPWTVRGRALVCLARSREDHALGVLAFPRYTETPVGPYDEALWMPMHAPPLTVPVIRVSTEESVAWGRRNWGLPKERAVFAWKEEGDRWEVTARAPEASFPFAHLVVEGRGVRMPVPVGWLPPWARRVEQAYEGRTYQFCPSGDGTGRFARVRVATVGGSGFPALDVVVAVQIDGFTAVLPAADVVAAAVP